MPVSALELRPRGPIALVDAAIRLSSRSAGAWALTLPAGALLFAALVALSEAIHRGRGLVLPSLLLTAAWFARGVSQGAACHLLEQQILGEGEPTVLGSLKAALKRLPSLAIATGYLAVFNLLLATFTLGLYLFFVGWPVVGYAVTMQGKGPPLSLFGTSSKTLGASRSCAIWVRLCLWAQLLVALNIHLAANLLVYLGVKLLALDLTFAERFISLDNPAWLAAVAALSFAGMEPLRAAAATLLLIDGRVRQEGLDLLATIDQLPSRSPKQSGTASAAGLAVLLAGSSFCFSLPARAERTPGQLPRRLERVADRCGLSGPVLERQLQAAGELREKERSSLSRFVSELEALAYDQEDCQTATLRMEQGLPLMVQARDALHARGDEPSARQRAQVILNRPEFVPAAKPKADQPPAGFWSDFTKWWSKVWDRFAEWLKELLSSERSTPRRPEPAAGGGDFLANLVVVALVGAVLVVLVYLLLRARERASVPLEGAAGGAEETELAPDSGSALSRPPESWAQLADQLAGRGEFREAVRSLYLALLSRLHREGAIDYDPAKSNWDYLRGFRGQTAWVPPFRELTRRFDFTYYGNIGATPDGYREFRQLSGPLLAPSPERREAAGA